MISGLLFTCLCLSLLEFQIEKTGIQYNLWILWLLEHSCKFFFIKVHKCKCNELVQKQNEHRGANWQFFISILDSCQHQWVIGLLLLHLWKQGSKITCKQRQQNSNSSQERDFPNTSVCKLQKGQAGHDLLLVSGSIHHQVTMFVMHMLVLTVLSLSKTVIMRSLDSEKADSLWTKYESFHLVASCSLICNKYNKL